MRAIRGRSYHRRWRAILSSLGVMTLLALNIAMPIAAFAQEPSGGVRVEPGSDSGGFGPFLPGTEPIVEFALGADSALVYFHAPVGTYHHPPEEIAAAIEAARDEPGFRVLKVYSVVELEDPGLYAVRYQSNQSLGITRNIVYNEIVTVFPETGAQAGGFVFIDPLFAMQWPDPDPTWRTVVGGIGAVAAAAAAMAAALASGGAAAAGAAAGAAGASSSGGNRSTDPNQVIGHILQLSAKRIDVTPARPAALEASVWRVKGDGSYEAAPDCEVILVMPDGFTASAERGFGSLSVTISQTPGAQSPTWIAVHVNGPGSGTSDQVELVGEMESRIVWRLEPADKLLVPNGRDTVTLIADVTLSPSAEADPAVTLEQVRDSITFTPRGEWGEVSEPVVWSDGARAVSVAARTPRPDRHMTAPSEVPVSLSATVGDEGPVATAIVPCQTMPELEIVPDELVFAQGCGKTFELLARVVHDAGLQWHITYSWASGSTPLGDLAEKDTGPAQTTILLTERPPAEVNPRNHRTFSRLEITAQAEGFDDLQRSILIGSAREGLFAETGPIARDGSLHIAADGSATPSDLGFQAFVADPETAMIVADDTLVRDLAIEPADEPGSPARNAWEFAKIDPHLVEVRDIGRGPSGVYRFMTEEVVPGKTTTLPLRAHVSVPGHPVDIWSYDLRLTLDTPANAPGSEAWQVEYDRCRKIIIEFTPTSHQDRLFDILERHGKVLGPEGLAELRMRIWHISAELILAEGAQGYKSVEAWANRIYTVLDWADWAGKIAFGVVVKYYTGPYGAFAAKYLRAMLISTIHAYQDGKTPQQWLYIQLKEFAKVVEGTLVSPDNFAKLPLSTKARGWAIFVAYNFFKEFFYNGKSFVRAIQDAGWSVADEIIGDFLSAELKTAKLVPPTGA